MFTSDPEVENRPLLLMLPEISVARDVRALVSSVRADLQKQRRPPTVGASTVACRAAYLPSTTGFRMCAMFAPLGSIADGAITMSKPAPRAAREIMIVSL